MIKDRIYIVKYTDLGTEDLSLSPLHLSVEASNNTNARTAFRQEMKAGFGILEGRDYRIDSITLDDIPRASLKIKNGSKMNLREAENILGNRARWEVLNMKKALSSIQILNTPGENERLEACKVWLKHHK